MKSEKRKAFKAQHEKSGGVDITGKCLEIKIAVLSHQLFWYNNCYFNPLQNYFNPFNN